MCTVALLRTYTHRETYNLLLVDNLERHGGGTCVEH